MVEENLPEMIERLERSPSTLLVLNDGSVVFSSSAGGLVPLIDYIDQIPDLPAKGRVAVDKIVGGAAARLFSYAGIDTVFTPLASRAAVDICDREGLGLFAESVVEAIENPRTGEPCLLEELSTDFRNNEDFYREVKERVNS